MGKRGKRIKEIKIKNKEQKLKNKQFFKKLLSILPFLILLFVSINSFIFYYFISNEGLIFLYNLFDSGNFIIPSAFIVVMILGFQVLIIKKLAKQTKNVLIIYYSITLVYFAAAPSLLYNLLINNKLNWTTYLIAEYFWEFIAIFIIIYEIKKYSNLNHSSTPNKI